MQTEVIKSVQSALALPKDDPARVDAIGKVRDETTKWVAKYRRDGTFQGRASYGWVVSNRSHALFLWGRDKQFIAGGALFVIISGPHLLLFRCL